MTNTPDGKPPAASDDARASDGHHAEARRAEAVTAADQRVDGQKKKSEASLIEGEERDMHQADGAPADTVSEAELVTEAVEKGSDA